MSQIPMPASGQPAQRVPPPMPGAALDYRGGTGGIDNGAWHFQKILFTYNNAILPERCIKCNASDGIKMKKQKFIWVHPLLYLLVLVNLLIAAIVILIVQKKSTLTYGQCAVHRRKRLNVIWIVLGILAVGILFVVLAIMRREAQYLAVTLAAIVAAAICGFVAGPVLKPQKINKDGIGEYKGSGKAFLETLPHSQFE